jgi:hypothetical protein
MQHRTVNKPLTGWGGGPQDQGMETTSSTYSVRSEQGGFVVVNDQTGERVDFTWTSDKAHALDIADRCESGEGVPWLGYVKGHLTCGTCGASVVHRAKAIHERWHAELRS